MLKVSPEIEDKVFGGLYGLALGDAVGVPYEFRRPTELPEEIDIVALNNDWIKTYPNVEWGTWSDDTAMALCLLDSVLRGGRHDFQDMFISNIINWRFNGLFAVGGRVFDIGMQTQAAIEELEGGILPKDRIDPQAYGNGALMRSLPVALLCQNDDLIEVMTEQHVMCTHANELCIATSLLYTWIAARLVRGVPLEQAYEQSWTLLKSKGDKYEHSVSMLEYGRTAPYTGTGFVVDSFWSALQAVRDSTDFKSAVINAIRYGNDTDTTACIAGGLAGIIYGCGQLPEDWLVHLRQISMIDEMVEDMKL